MAKWTSTQLSSFSSFHSLGVSNKNLMMCQWLRLAARRRPLFLFKFTVLMWALRSEKAANTKDH